RERLRAARLRDLAHAARGAPAPRPARLLRRGLRPRRPRSRGRAADRRGGLVILLVWLAAASAEEPRTAEAIVVPAQRELEEARRQVEEKLEEAGYDRVIERDGKTIYRHADVFKGQVVVDDDGWVRFERQPIRLDPPDLGKRENTVGDWMGCLLWPTACIK